MQKLNLVHPKTAPAGAQVTVDLRLSGGLLEAGFEVRGIAPRANPDLEANSSQWGLWDWDVVELFLRLGDDPEHYYEFQVSPLGQYFELEIFEPRKRFDRGFSSGFSRGARVRPEGWEATLGIPLARLGWDGDPSRVTGNAFAILGEPASRTYWSLFLGYQERPDFHLPAFFRPLLSPARS